MANCNCDYTVNLGQACRTRVFVTETSNTVQKRIDNQVRVPSSMYAMKLAANSSAAARLASQTKINWNQMSDRVVAAQQTVVHPTHGNSLRTSLTSGKPGSSTPGGTGVDVKHDSYARYLNRKKASNIKTCC